MFYYFFKLLKPHHSFVPPQPPAANRWGRDDMTFTVIVLIKQPPLTSLGSCKMLQVHLLRLANSFGIRLDLTCETVAQSNSLGHVALTHRLD